MDKNWVWAGIGGGILVALLATSRRKDYAQLKGVSDGDIENTARTLLSEAFGKAESASIVQVAINRARNRNTTLSDVVAAGSNSTWNDSDLFAALVSRAKRDPRFQAAKDFVIEVLNNQHPNPSGERKHFVHPAAKGFAPPCATNGRPRVLVQTFAGDRCLPPWAVTNQIKVGAAIFSA